MRSFEPDLPPHTFQFFGGFLETDRLFKTHHWIFYVENFIRRRFVYETLQSNDYERSVFLFQPIYFRSLKMKVYRLCSSPVLKSERLFQIERCTSFQTTWNPYIIENPEVLPGYPEMSSTPISGTRKRLGRNFWKKERRLFKVQVRTCLTGNLISLKPQEIYPKTPNWVPIGFSKTFRQKNL